MGPFFWAKRGGSATFQEKITVEKTGEKTKILRKLLEALSRSQK